MSTADAGGSGSTLADTQEAARLMLDFAERTGLTSHHPQRRYLWTDAFAVCNFLAAEQRLNEAHYGSLALDLIDRVHHTLGQHRSDDSRRGWIGGQSAAKAEAHPTLGGLRVGKPLPERLPGDVANAQLEWERDGQYFHYLTKWMHALDRVASRRRIAQLNRWARELAEKAHAAFVEQPARGGSERMFWKMSIDLSRPLVTSMGQHDPLDGWLTCLELQVSATTFPRDTGGPTLNDAVADFARMAVTGDPMTSDPLGLGGLLADAYRAHQLLRRGAALEPGLVGRLLEAAVSGLAQYMRQGELLEPAARRLAFRELGLAIGISAVELLTKDVHAVPGPAGDTVVLAALDALGRYSALGAEIRAFWRKAESRASRSWAQHRDINDVMLATSLMPEGFLVLEPGARAALDP